MKFHVLKLLAPRPTFMSDMTLAERALMQEHSAYWRSLMAKGSVVVFGPVADPAGPYGLAVLRLGDSDDPRALAAEDPIIKAGAGFAFTFAPMVSAVLPS